MHLGPVEERVGSARRAVDELIDDDELTGMDVRLQRARRARRDDRAHTELVHRPDVGPVGDAVRRELVPASVAREERDPAIADGADRDRSGRRAVRGVERDRLDVVEEGVEARAAEDADVGAGHGSVAGAARARRRRRRSRRREEVDEDDDGVAMTTSACGCGRRGSGCGRRSPSSNPSRRCSTTRTVADDAAFLPLERLSVL